DATSRSDGSTAVRHGRETDGRVPRRPLAPVGAPPRSPSVHRPRYRCRSAAAGRRTAPERLCAAAGQRLAPARPLPHADAARVLARTAGGAHPRAARLTTRTPPTTAPAGLPTRRAAAAEQIRYRRAGVLSGRNRDIPRAAAPRRPRFGGARRVFVAPDPRRVVSARSGDDGGAPSTSRAPQTSIDAQQPPRGAIHPLAGLFRPDL